jgi:hypothetical protein
VANLFVQQKTVQSTSSVSSLTTSAMTVTAGNALVAASSANGSVGLVTTDSQGDVFAIEVASVSPFLQIVQYELATGAAGGSTTWTLTPSASAFVSLAVQEYAGMAVSPVDTVGHGQGAGSTPTPGSLDPVPAGDAYVSAWTHDGGANQTFTPAPGWTLRSTLTLTANMPLGTEELIGSGPQEGRVTLGAPAPATWDCVAMALRAADVAAPDDGNNPNFVVAEFPMANRGFGE